MKALIRSLPLALLVLLFVYAAASKLLAFDLFRIQLRRQPFPVEIAAMLAFALPTAELLAAGLLLFLPTRLVGFRLSLALLYFFTGYIILVLLHFWNRVPCPCGGILEHLSWGWHLVLNLLFLSVNLVAIRIHREECRTGTT